MAHPSTLITADKITHIIGALYRYSSSLRWLLDKLVYLANLPRVSPVLMAAKLGEVIEIF